MQIRPSRSNQRGPHTYLSAAFLIALGAIAIPAAAQDTHRPYRLESVNIKQRIIWGAQCLYPQGRGLAFGGQDQQAEDGRPRTRVLVNGQWKTIGAELRKNNPLQERYEQTWQVRDQVRGLLSSARSHYLKGHADDTSFIAENVTPQLTRIKRRLVLLMQTVKFTGQQHGDHGETQSEFVSNHLDQSAKLVNSPGQRIEPHWLGNLHRAQIHLELAAEALDAEPPPRAMNCGAPRRKGDAAAESQTIVYDKKTKLYIIFGGDHLDYLTNDTWVFDPQKQRWYQRHPPNAPPPRANHRLVATGNGKVTMTGGYTYSSNTDYLGGQYRDLNDGDWVYDIEANTWTSKTDRKLVAPDSRVYRTGPFHPDFYLQGDRPDAASFAKYLEGIPSNTWVATDPPYKPRLNRDWGTARIDPSRDIMLRWSGGHSAHGGTDVPHFHFSTNRWELKFPVEFPLGQLYSNTSYPNGFNFNLRPWMTGHTYQNYAFDPPSRKMVKAGRPNHFYIYDPDLGDWIGRGAKPKAMVYNSCFYTLTLTATPNGALCWDRYGKVHLYDHSASAWKPLELTGQKLPGAVVDNSTIVYDSKRKRVLLIAKRYGRDVTFDGQVYSVELKTGKVSALSPEGAEHTKRFANIDKSCYDAANDLLVVGTYLTEAGEQTPTPAYDCTKNRWITLDFKYELGKRGKRTVRRFPHTRSDALMYDPMRKLIWGVDTNGQVYVLRIELESAGVKPLR